MNKEKKEWQHFLNWVGFIALTGAFGSCGVWFAQNADSLAGKAMWVFIALFAWAVTMYWFTARTRRRQQGE